MNRSGLEKARQTLPDEDYPFPRYVIVEPTNICNLNCIMCPSSSQTRPRGIMELALFKKIIDEIVEKSPGTYIWPAIMGEALMAGDRFFEMMEYAAAKGARIVLNTNAVLFTEQTIDRIGKLNLTEIIVGIDAFTRETYDKIRCGGDFDRVVSNVRKMLAQRWEHTRVTVQFIVQELNEHEEKAFRSFWLDRGAAVKIRQKLGWGRGVEAANLIIPQEARDMPCPWLLRTLSIHWDGTIVQCDGDWNAEHPAGTIRNESIESVWKNELARRRARHRALDFDFEPCSKCDDWQAGLSDFYFPDDPGLPAVQREPIGARA
ncbi:radical SAM protein [bacterium]|nr:radical SAM protein [bacterium]